MLGDNAGDSQQMNKDAALAELEGFARRAERSADPEIKAVGECARIMARCLKAGHARMATGTVSRFANENMI